MQGGWYKVFLGYLWYYYKLKKIIILLIKVYVIVKLISIGLDYYYGYFPFIFKNRVIVSIGEYYYIIWKIQKKYWNNIMYIIVLFGVVSFWYWYRIPRIDLVELKKREKEKEKKKEEEKTEKKDNFQVNIQEKKVLIKKKLKNMKKIFI